MNKADQRRGGIQNLEQAHILVTGGAGFIGSNFIRYVFDKKRFQGVLVNLDAITYAGNLMSLDDINQKFGGKQYFFEREDIRHFGALEPIFRKYDISLVVHFAAESHVDRSIFGPKDFVETNINGTFNLIETARKFWNGRSNVRFHHISTDEVYGSLGESGYFYETTPYDPRSPYSASKAASDHLVRAYMHTYGLPATISNCSNNYGPYHFPEKLIPLMILNALEAKPLPVYGDGRNVRDWLYVEDHCDAIWSILEKGVAGETYNVGGECEKRNIDVVQDICDTLETIKPRAGTPAKRYRDLMTFVPDRPGHDRRYAINCDKIKQELGWSQHHRFEEGLRNTIIWYIDHAEWVNAIRNHDYLKWIEQNYSTRK